MITKAQVKEIRALATAKGRNEAGTYLVEGDKLCREWLVSDQELVYIVGTTDWLAQNEALMARHTSAEILTVKEDDLLRIATQTQPNQAVIVAKKSVVKKALPKDEWCLALDVIQDPGNLGTIIRIADWFGIQHIISAPDTADYYNPKVVAAAMGGHLRVQLHKSPLAEFLASYTRPILAATLNGNSILDHKSLSGACLIIGNESKGIRNEVVQLATEQVSIPRYGGAESLNAAVATGILLSVLVRG